MLTIEEREQRMTRLATLFEKVIKERLTYKDRAKLLEKINSLLFTVK